MSITIYKSGPLATIQDLGRKHIQHMGISSSGASDEFSFRWANKLLANDQNCACIEITLGPFISEFTKATEICITGAHAECSINDVPISLWKNYRVNKGDVLHIAMAQHGLRFYLAVKQGFQTPSYFGSRSFNPRELPITPNLSTVLDGMNLDYLEVKHTNSFQQVELDEQYIPDHQEPLELALLSKNNFRSFSKESKSSLLSTSYKILSDSNKMAYRLSGEVIEFTGRTQASSGVCLGSVQIPENGQPIILLKDRQTIGGYPVIGNIASIDTFKLTQRRPGEEINFKESTIKKEEVRLRKFLTFFQSVQH